MKPGREHETACRGWEHPGLYGEPGGFLRGLGKHVGSPTPHTPSAGWVFLLERLGEHKHPAQPHMKGIIREQHPALTMSGQRSKAASSIKPHQDRELLLGMDSCGPPHPIPASQNRSLQGGNAKPRQHEQAFLHPLLPASLPVAQGSAKKKENRKKFFYCH